MFWDSLMTLLESAIARMFLLAVFCTLINLFGPAILKSDKAVSVFWKIEIYLSLTWIVLLVGKVAVCHYLEKGKKQ
uniref:Holin n=1 Tax=Pantoea phage Survivor TaxID=3232176 RepID=A0AAU8KXW9_9CAUD